ncbi:MAG TPA: hypothetical protein VME21_01580 [Steroidobacteraceae bacterium]|nr:hypothetical protein [Steroidobacteraceae bacterium]
MSAALSGLVGACALAFTVLASASEPPLLLNYASTLSYSTQPDEADNRRRLARVSHQLAQNPPPAKDCAQTLGAQRFTALLMQLGGARGALGDAAGAIEAYQRALGCSPRAVYLLASLGQELMNAGRYAEARAVLLRGLAVDRANLSLATQLALLDFIEERWQEAITRLRWVATAEVDERRAAYWECFLWLAQRRAHLRPQSVSRPLGSDWSSTLFRQLQADGELKLLSSLMSEPAEERRREELLEALYYVGERRLAEGDTAGAQHYFAAAVNLKVPSFLEHHMALAELSKLR